VCEVVFGVAKGDLPPSLRASSLVVPVAIAPFPRSPGLGAIGDGRSAERQDDEF
jgi:hypothetical protein